MEYKEQIKNDFVNESCGENTSKWCLFESVCYTGRTHLGFRVKLVKGTGGVGLPIYFGLAQLVVSLIWLWICLSWYLFCLFSRDYFELSWSRVNTKTC